MAILLQLLLLSVLISLSHPITFSPSSSEEVFTEELLLRPLPDRKVLTHFHYQTSAPPTNTYGRHHRLFPKAIYQLVQKFRIQQMELSFTQGRWDYERWGGSDPVSSSNAKPPGVELWAVFDVPPDQVDETWKNLTHTLSGLFCASINFLESTTAYSAPTWGFGQFSGNLRYGALPREAVCTENLTPWLKLLPCRDKAGLASILDRPSIYNGFYHSQRLQLTSTEFGLEEGVKPGIVLQQTLTVVLKPSDQIISSTYSTGKLQTSWSLNSIFGRRGNKQCVLAQGSNIFIELDRGLVSQLNKIGVKADMASEGSWINPGFELPVKPDRVINELNRSHSSSSSILYEFSVDKYNWDETMDIGLMWKLPVVWLCLQAPFHSSRFLMGSGNERGSIAISLRSTDSSQGFMDGNVVGGECKVRAVVYQVVPWYVKVYFHTLQVSIDGKAKMVMDIVEKIHVSPSEDKVSPGMMEMALQFPCSAKSVVLTVEFDKGFLHIDEYPPDANQGFDIPSALISFPDVQANVYYLEEKSLTNSPMLYKFQEKTSVVSYTEVLLVPLATPDFSMPYNVITITCTVFALYFGSLLNVLRRRVGEEERLLKSKAAERKGLIPRLLSKVSSKLRGIPEEPSKSSSPSPPLLGTKLILKVMLVAGAAVYWHYYFG